MCRIPRVVKVRKRGQLADVNLQWAKFLWVAIDLCIGIVQATFWHLGGKGDVAIAGNRAYATKGGVRGSGT